MLKLISLSVAINRTIQTVLVSVILLATVTSRVLSLMTAVVMLKQSVVLVSLKNEQNSSSTFLLNYGNSR